MLCLILLAAPCASQDSTEPAITAGDLSARIKILASDEFEGRGPASPGEEKTVAYLIEQVQRAGLAPGNGDSFVQEVPLVSTRPTEKPEVSIDIDGEAQDFVFGRDVMIVSPRPNASLDTRGAELVFCGFGVTAPEYGWNDFEGVDLAGKVVVCLVNDPGFATQDPQLFRGNAMTYYGRYTYKFEEARRQGAVACLVVHEEEAAGYPWQVVNRSWGGEQHGLGNAGDRPDFEGWVTRASIARIATAAGHDWDALELAARSAEFRAVSLGATACFALTNQSRRSQSRNVLAKVVGSTHPDETVLLCAHWDHLGRKEGLGSDEIYNGAHDNASGTAGLLEIAEALAAMDPPPERSVLFLWVTAEESGLLGSKYYAENPIEPLNKTVAGINMDGLNLYGPMLDLEVVGFGASELEELLAQAAAAQDRYLTQEATPEKGYYYRSDHFSLAKQGVPMLYAGGGQISREHGREWVTEQNNHYLRRHYHQPSDEFNPDWDLRGALEDLRLYYALARRLANSGEWPNWHASSEFRALRDRSLEQAQARLLQVDPASITWKAPESWTDQGARVMRHASYQAAPETEAYMAFARGGMLANYNRWCAQVGVSPISEAELGALPTITILGRECPLLEVSGEYQGMGNVYFPSATLVGAMCSLEGDALFVKMIGPTAEVSATMEQFRTFCGSIGSR